jgi:hypothetical protein
MANLLLPALFVRFSFLSQMNGIAFRAALCWASAAITSDRLPAGLGNRLDCDGA